MTGSAPDPNSAPTLERQRYLCWVENKGDQTERHSRTGRGSDSFNYVRIQITVKAQ